MSHKVHSLRLWLSHVSAARHRAVLVQTGDCRGHKTAPELVLLGLWHSPAPPGGKEFKLLVEWMRRVTSDCMGLAEEGLLIDL